MQRGRRFRPTLSQQFLLISLAILLSGMLVIGWWVASRIEQAVVNHAANVTAFYMNTFIPPLLEDLSDDDTLDDIHQHVLDHLLTDTPLTEEVLSINVWTVDDLLIYSNNTDLIGTNSDLNHELSSAWEGQIVSRLSVHITEGQSDDAKAAIIETFAPVRDSERGDIAAVVETHQDAEPLLVQVRDAQRQSWLVVGIATVAMYGLLTGFVHRASRTIDNQQSRLQQSVSELSTLLKENRMLRQRVQTAAERATEINEEFLQRIGRDLHDGPAQDLALALLRINDLDTIDMTQRQTIHYALDSALSEIRTLAAGLQLPALTQLDTPAVAWRAVREFQHKTSTMIDFSVDEPMPTLSLLKKITLYRVITEALHNSYRHADANQLRGRMWSTETNIYVEVADNGPGFEPEQLDNQNGHLGLIGLQQRVALLDGTFDIQSSKQAGTCLNVRLPIKGADHA